jgi:hypothetical protein
VPEGPAGAASDRVAVSEIAALKANVDALARELGEVRATLARLMEELGVRR